jgi:hypothetical protein
MQIEGVTMVYNTQNYWDSGLCPSTRILNTREHNGSDIASVSGRMPCSAMWGCVGLVITDVSEQSIACIFRVERKSKLETALAVTSRLP